MGKVIFKDKIRYAENLRKDMVTIEGREIKIKALNGEVILSANDGDDMEELRSKVHDLIKGTPCGVESVKGLLELCL